MVVVSKILFQFFLYPIRIVESVSIQFHKATTQWLAFT